MAAGVTALRFATLRGLFMLRMLRTNAKARLPAQAAGFTVVMVEDAQRPETALYHRSAPTAVGAVERPRHQL